MDLVYYRASMILKEEEEEDRISNLPHDVILHILSFLDLKYAVQTSELSRKWKNMWTSITRLNLNSRMFHTMPQFAKFVKHALYHRNKRTEVSTVELTFSGPTTQFFVKDLVNYAYLYNVRQLTLICSTWTSHELPRSLFSSHTLKHLTLDNKSNSKNTRIPILAWDFPALETINLSNMCLVDGGDKRLDLFSKCVNLKDLTLHGLSMHGLEIFNVYAPQLINLSITDSVTFPKVFEVVAPQLKNLTATVSKCPKTFIMTEPCFLYLSTKGFNSLEKVNLSMSKPFDNKEAYGSIRLARDKKEGHGPRLLDLFQILRSAKVLILDVYIVQCLSSSLDHLLHIPCPFNKLKFLKINMMPQKQNGRIATIPVQVRNYLLEYSRSATFIVDFSQVPQKRPREQVPTDTVSRKVAKLQEQLQLQDQVIEQNKSELQKQTGFREYQTSQIRRKDQVIAHQRAKIQTQDEDIAKQKETFEELKLQHDNLKSDIIKYKMEEMKVIVESKNLNYEVIRSMSRDMKAVVDMIPESLRGAVKARVSSLYEGLKSLVLNHIDDSQWEDIETELGDITDSVKSLTDNFHILSDGPAAEVDILTSSSDAWLGGNIVVQPSESSHE